MEKDVIWIPEQLIAGGGRILELFDIHLMQK
jgi:hypothetical protein